MNRQEGYYWVKYFHKFEIAWWKHNIKLSGINKYWLMIGSEVEFEDSDFEHINEVRIKMPGELPD